MLLLCVLIGALLINNSVAYSFLHSNGSQMQDVNNNKVMMAPKAEFSAINLNCPGYFEGVKFGWMGCSRGLYAESSWIVQCWYSVANEKAVL